MSCLGPDVILSNKNTHPGSRFFEIAGNKFRKIDEGEVAEFSILAETSKSHPFFSRKFALGGHALHTQNSYPFIHTENSMPTLHLLYGNAISFHQNT